MNSARGAATSRNSSFRLQPDDAPEIESPPQYTERHHLIQQLATTPMTYDEETAAKQTPSPFKYPNTVVG